eukprot:3937240-Rhodomonas_salina.2
MCKQKCRQGRLFFALCPVRCQLLARLCAQRGRGRKRTEVEAMEVAELRSLSNLRSHALKSLPAVVRQEKDILKWPAINLWTPPGQ